MRARQQSDLLLYFVPKTLRMHTVDEESLVSLAEGHSPIALAMFSLTVGICVALGITVATVNLTDPYAYAAFVLGTAGMFVLSIFFGVLAIRERRASQRRLKAILESDRTRE